MLNPTFASFKTIKTTSTQAANPAHQPVLSQINMNMQPKTFHQLKTSTNIRNQNNNQDNKLGINHLPPEPTKLSFCSSNQSRKTPTSYCIRKNYSQFLMQPQSRGQCGQIMKSKPKINTKNCLTAKKNYVQVERQSKEKTIRPVITGPTLLKNKSFIYTYNHQVKQNLTARPSQDKFKNPYIFGQDISIQSIEKRSDDASISIQSSNGQKESNSFFNSSKFDDSLNLKNSCSSSKLDEKTLNFSRKTKNSIVKGNLGKLMNEQSSGQLSSLSLMARQMKSSYQSQTQSADQQTKKYYQKSSINFSKKFQHYKNIKSNSQLIKPITIDQFQLMQQIGQGKYGKVFMARHKSTNFICALKAISKAKIKQQNIQQPLIRQIKIQMYLNHPNIVKLYGFFHDKQNLYLIMECCLSGHLLKLIKHRRIFQQNQILDIISSVFQAVSFLHCHGVIHRDLKPQNIVIQNGVYKICDFGWAAYAKGDTRTTFCGTPLYVCPEVLKGNQYDAKADVWGLGVLTYQLAYGRVPFPIWSQADMIKIVKDPVYFPTWTSVSDRMQNLIKQMLNKDPVRRLSLNQILSSPLIRQYVGTRLGFRSQVQALF